MLAKLLLLDLDLRDVHTYAQFHSAPEAKNYGEHNAECPEAVGCNNDSQSSRAGMYQTITHHSKGKPDITDTHHLDLPSIMNNAHSAQLSRHGTLLRLLLVPLLS